jgi:hypothetical protein
VIDLRPTIKVLFMPGCTGNALAQQGLLNPELHLIEKPFVPEDLCEKLRMVLGLAPPALRL